MNEHQVSYYGSYSDEPGPGMTVGQKMNDSNYPSKEDAMNAQDYGNFLRLHDKYDTGYVKNPEEDLSRPSYESNRKKTYVHAVGEDFDHVMQDIEDSYEVH